MMEEILIPFGDKLYSLEPNWANQDWRYGILETEEGPYSGTWWQMDAVDDNGDTYLMCWYEESVDVDDEDGLYPWGAGTLFYCYNVGRGFHPPV